VEVIDEQIKITNNSRKLKLFKLRKMPEVWICWICKIKYSVDWLIQKLFGATEFIFTTNTWRNIIPKWPLSALYHVQTFDTTFFFFLTFLHTTANLVLPTSREGTYFLLSHAHLEVLLAMTVTVPRGSDGHLELIRPLLLLIGLS